MSSNPGMLTMDGFLRRRTFLPPNVYRRMVAAVFMQSFYTPHVDLPSKTLQTGKLVLITGGSVGIGYETAKGMCERGANVVIASRDSKKLEEACECLRSRCKFEGSIDFIPMDLADMESVLAFVAQFTARFHGRKIDILIENAGVWPREYSVSAQGYEYAFAANCLGHYLLRSKLNLDGLLAPKARIVVVTGDIYIKCDDCTKDFKYSGDGEAAYCRSKLGVHWLLDEFHRRHTEQYHVVIVHPGVVRTELSIDNKSMFGLAKWMKSAVFLTEEQGAQTPLICATAKNHQLVNGGYYHNTCGLVQLGENDPVNDLAKSKAFIAEVESIVVPYLARKD